MADTPYTGLTASVKVGSDEIGYISGVDLTLENNIVEILSFGDAWKKKVATIKDWSASIDGTAAFSTGGSQKALYDAFVSGAEITLGVYLSDTVFFSGSGIVEKLNIQAAPDDKISISCDVAGSGANVLTLPAGGGT